MPVIVDGYNFMHALRDSRWGSAATGRTTVCRLLGEWSEVSGQAVTVIFDGVSPSPAVIGQVSDPRIRVDYSGGQRTADAAIGELILRSSAPRGTLVVSSDHEVQRSARRRDAQTLDSADFCARVHRDLDQSARRRPDIPAGKHDGVKHPDRDEWLRQFGYDPTEDAPFEHP